MPSSANRGGMREKTTAQLPLPQPLLFGFYHTCHLIVLKSLEELQGIIGPTLSPAQAMLCFSAVLWAGLAFLAQVLPFLLV